MCRTNDVAVIKADKLLNGIEITLKTVVEPQVSVVLVNLPNRHHFAHWLCLNREIEKTDLELKNLCEKFSNVTVRLNDGATYIYSPGCAFEHEWEGSISEKFSNVTCGGQYNRATYTYSPGCAFEHKWEEVTSRLDQQSSRPPYHHNIWEPECSIGTTQCQCHRLPTVLYLRINDNSHQEQMEPMQRGCFKFIN